ncbi:carboxymuconolactone decarboxylase family protein [Danxiaibacter flavus]|uniref:Carboxymuconolactone decarboxylase family protein n=1 Tax=Danxiaibacter flavus TaxID=3049108 RepID=A0ABV3ZLK6_9BACT|nr:carboxymuconolactone decarboxylase family protein [Chitinophagaceae bacterium DXS]
MKQRTPLRKIQPPAYKAMFTLDEEAAKVNIDPLYKELIKIRASQINGCSYCVNSHSKDARKKGMSEQKLYLISAWREAENIFNEEELLLLQMTEEITLIHQHGLSDDAYERSIALFGEQTTAEIIMAIVTINAWNRIGVATKLQPPVEVEEVA